MAQQAREQLEQQMNDDVDVVDHSSLLLPQPLQPFNIIGSVLIS